MTPTDETPATDRDVLLGGSGETTLREKASSGAPRELTEEERKRRRRKIAMLIAILIALAIIAIIILRSLGGDSPLPGIPTELPSHVDNIYGTAAPMGVAVSPEGDRIYVTESEGKRMVRVFDSDGNEVDKLRPPGKKSEWRLPVYVAVDPENGDVYVSDRLREEISIYDEDGEYVRALRPKGKLGKGANPLGLAFDSEGVLYATNVNGGRKHHNVLVFGEGDEPQRAIGTGDFWFPNGLAIDPNGNLYVSDSNNGRLAIFDSAGTLKASIQRGVGEGDLGLPRGVAIDGDDRLFVVDTTAHAVKVYEIGDQAEVPAYIGSFGVEGVGEDQFHFPNGVAVDGDGRIYVTDRENHRVQIWSY